MPSLGTCRLIYTQYQQNGFVKAAKKTQNAEKLLAKYGGVGGAADSAADSRNFTGHAYRGEGVGTAPLLHPSLSQQSLNYNI